MNTVFKFYEQAWVLFGLASAYVLWRMAHAGLLSPRRIGPLRGTWLAVGGILAVGVLIYPVLGTQARLRDRFNTNFMGIDGSAYMNEAVQYENGKPLQLKYDKEAIDWLNRNISGSPVIVEGLTPLYQWGNRVSIYTGLPAVIGWDWHETQQRTSDSQYIAQRRQQVAEIYSTPDPRLALQLMQKYHARYLYVGGLEKAEYPASGIAKFAQMQNYGLKPIYSNRVVTIYSIPPAPASGSGP